MTLPSVAPMITLYLFGELLFGVDGELFFGVDGELSVGVGGKLLVSVDGVGVDGELLFGVGGELLFVNVDKYVVPGISTADVGVNDVSVGTPTSVEGSLCNATTVVVVDGNTGPDTAGVSQSITIFCAYLKTTSGHSFDMHMLTAAGMSNLSEQ